MGAGGTGKRGEGVVPHGAGGKWGASCPLCMQMGVGSQEVGRTPSHVVLHLRKWVQGCGQKGGLLLRCHGTLVLT